MEKLKQITNGLTDVKASIDVINKDDILQLKLKDLKHFYKLSKVQSVSFEKEYKKLLIDNKNIDILISSIESDIKIYFLFYNKNKNKLDLINKSSIIENSLFFERKKRKQSLEDYKLAYSKLDEITSKIENSFLYLSDKSEEIIRLNNLEKKLKNDWKKIGAIYYSNCDYYDKKYEEIGVYSLFNFHNIYTELNKISKIINSHKKKYIIDDSNNLINLEIVSIAYKLTYGFFDYKISENELLNRLNLRMLPEKRIIKNNYIQKFLYIIKRIENILNLPKDELNIWVKELLKLWGLKLSTYNKGRLVDEKSEFKIAVDGALLHLEKKLHKLV